MLTYWTQISFMQNVEVKLTKRDKPLRVPLEKKCRWCNGRESEWRIHLFKLSGGDYNTWTIYLMTEYEIWFLAQKSTEWTYKKSYHIFAKIDHVTPYFLRAKSGLYDYVEKGIKAVFMHELSFKQNFFKDELSILRCQK